MLVLLLFACGTTTPSIGKDDTAPPVDDTDDTDSSPPTDSEDPCAPVEGLAITSVEGSSQASMVLAHRLTIGLSAPATVAVACVSDADPAEVHLLEASGTDQVTLDVGGLLGDTAYSCSVAPVCPASTAAPIPYAFTTGPLPSHFPTAQVTRHPTLEMTGGAYTIVNHSKWCYGDQQRLLLYDPEGAIRWYDELPYPEMNVGIQAEYLGDGLFYWGGGYSTNGRPHIDDLYANPVYTASFPGVNRWTYHHDSRQFDTADLLLALHYTTNSDADGDRWTGFGLVMTDPTDESIVWQYSSQSAYDEGALPGSGGGADAWHANAVDMREVDGRDVVYVSLYYLAQVIAIDTTDDRVLWTFGYGGDFTLVDPAGAPLPDDHFPQGQHGIDVDGDRMILYDNGYWRGESRAVQYTLDTDRMVATEDWVWTDPGWYEEALGDADWLPDGHVLVTQAHIECYWPGRPQQVVEGDVASGEAVWRLTWDDIQDAGYRAERVDPCDVFGDVRYCPDAAAALERVGPLLGL